MFLNFLKHFFTQKIVKKSLSDVSPAAGSATVRTVGLLLDETYFYEKQELIDDLMRNGIDAEQVSVLVFKNRIKKNERFDYPVFSLKDLSWQATFSDSDVKDFIAKPFDLLINYYDVEKGALLAVSNASKAKFKVGFASVDKKVNHFMIDTQAEKHDVFIDELFKYLKILNKI